MGVVQVSPGLLSLHQTLTVMCHTAAEVHYNFICFGICFAKTSIYLHVGIKSKKEPCALLIRFILVWTSNQILHLHGLRELLIKLFFMLHALQKLQSNVYTCTNLPGMAYGDHIYIYVCSTGQRQGTCIMPPCRTCFFMCLECIRHAK